jgi:N-acetylglutamate synthase
LATELLPLERIGFDIWRAPDTAELDGWRLRFAYGVTGRANSVWPNGDGALPLEAKLDSVEAWYAARGFPARYQLTAAARPPDLAEALAARGYRQAGAPAMVEVAPLVARPAGEAELAEELDDGWIGLWARTREFDRLDVARALLTGSPGRTAFARVGDLAIGRAVALDGWLGVTSMVTVPAARRRGHGRAILSALVAWGCSVGCTRGLLQVDTTNTAARALYAQFGFRPSHEYRYLVAS